MKNVVKSSKATNTDRPNGKAWKKIWKGQPPVEVIEVAQAQSRKAKAKSK